MIGMEKPHVNVSVTERAINVAATETSMRKAQGESVAAGALVTFVGTVRGSDGNGERIDSLTLEHYPGMTERKLRLLADRATSQHDLLGIELHHRFGTMWPGEVIVSVSVMSSHRGAAFDACREVVEHLKTDVPFWKKETGEFGERWVKPAFGEDRPALLVEDSLDDAR